MNLIASPFIVELSTRVKAASLSPFDGPTDFIRRVPLITNDPVYSTTTGKIYASLPSNVGSNGNSIAATPPTPTPSSSPAAAFVRQLELGTNDLVHIQATQKLYASVPSSEGSTGNSIAEIDPVTGSITNQVFVGSEPTVLAAAADGQTLYAGLEGASAIRRYNITTHTAGQQFPIGRDDFLGPFSFSDIAVSPGNPSVVAVARRNLCCTPRQEGVAVFDNGVQRPQTGPDHSSGSDFLAFASPSILYGSNDNSLTTMTVDSAGITVTGTAIFTAGNALIFNNNLVYGASGQVINPSTGGLVGTFSTGGFNTCHAIDPANNRAFFLVGQSSNIQLQAFDLTTFLPVGFIDLSGIVGGAESLVRWGSNGLAFRTSSRQVFLIQTALVNPSVPVPDPTPTPSPSPSPSPVEIPTSVRQVDIRANGLVFSQATQALYASVPSSAGAGGNSIRKITPETGVVGPAVFVGSEPNKMALALDGQTLYVHLDGANAVRRFNVVTETAGLQFNTNSTQSPFDMQVVPGSPQSVALSRRDVSDGVVIFDDGVQRPKTGGGFFPSETIDFGFNASTLYGTSRGDLVKFLVDSSGVTTSTVTSRLVGGNANAFEFSEGRLYSTVGRVVDPEARTWLGLLQGITFSALVVDDLLDRAFYAFESGPDVVIVGFDTNTFLPVGSIRLPSVFGVPVNLVRWGANGLAFNTESSSPQVYIVQTDLVSTAGTFPTGLRFEVDSQFAAEASTASVKVIRTGNPAGAISVNFATSNGTATAGSDYTATSGTLNFASGELSKVISIPTLNDNLFENGNETFTITLSNSVGASLTMPSTTTVAILDDDPKPSLSLSSNQRVVEGNSETKTLTFDVTLSNPSVQTVTVDFATANGTAMAGSDYVVSSGTLTIPALATSATFNVSINGDTTVEPNETFSVNLSNASNASSIVSSSATVTIDNDDASFQLSSASYTVQETAGFATVSITRVGDTSRVATVQFATADTAGLQSCTVANAKASERCDYATTVGRFQFEIGETGKTFFIPIVNDALVEGNETLTVNISAAVEATLAAPSTATITIVDNDTVPASQNPVDGVTFFVTQQYIDFLGRLPDTIGLANWTDTLGNCPNGGFGEFDNPTCDRVHVSAGFFLSEEFRGRGYFAYKFYEVGFDRRPTYAEFVPDMAQVGGPQSPESEVISKTVYTDAFVQRQEFKNRYDALSNSAYVDALETNADVVLTDKAALVAALNGNQKTRAQVLREIVELPSVTDKFFIRAFVAMQYFGYLRRDPDTIGYDNWVNTLTADPSNFRHIIFGFIFSDEYRRRFGP
ncbi:MAG TPA: Calx-beta domain-containing protein [Pyrinomonadaceae bacterium]|nr:Calx-beta domain-containing protein [Pyrinomonadaceae bacterium]